MCIYIYIYIYHYITLHTIHTYIPTYIPTYLPTTEKYSINNNDNSSNTKDTRGYVTYTYVDMRT